jgi:uncharacterized YccA/Bax inhibitor family protein
MANPILTEQALKQAAQRSTPVPGSTVWNPPVTDGPVTAWPVSSDAPDAKFMTIRGTASATSVLFVLLLGMAIVGWNAIETSSETGPKFPGLALVGILVGFGCVLAARFKPNWARFLAPVYALGEGFALGVISRFYEFRNDGIVLQAAGATLAVFGVMLLMYRLEVIKVTDRFRRIVIGATMGVMLFYGISMILNMFGSGVPFLRSSSMFGILFSLFVAGLAAFNLAIDFDMIEKGVKAKLPAHMEWFCALGLLVTIVWLYLEILRLLSKLRDR